MSVHITKMGVRGQVVIPKEIREALGATNETSFIASQLDEDSVVLRKLDTESYIKDLVEIRKRAAVFTDEEIMEEIKAVRAERRARQ